MNSVSIGDGALFLSQSRQNTQIKTQLNTLAGQLSSGEVADKTQVLNGNTARLSAIEYSLTTLTSKITRNSETALSLATMQRTLDSVNDTRVTMTENLTKISRESPQIQIDDAASSAVSQFSTIVNSLNMQVGGRSLFAGTAVDQSPLAPADDMLADLVTTIGGATDEATILAAVDDWFDDPAGGFATMGYLGDTGDQATRRIDETTVLTIEARADDAAIRSTLKGAVLAALAAEIPGLASTVQASLLFEGGVQLQSAAVDIVSVQARLGFVEEEVDRASTAATAEQAALSLARNDLIADDPFETATALQAVQLQLETHYQLTARLSQLSLAQYLR